MKKIEAPTLEEAYEKAALYLGCSITELHYEVIQHPSSGVLGFMKKNAIIVADCTKVEESKPTPKVAKPIIKPKEEPTFERRVTPKPTPKPKPTKPKHTLDSALTQKDQDVLDSFFENKREVESPEPKVELEEARPPNNNLELASKIEDELIKLLSYSCFAIDTVEVDVVENTALIFIDGDDAALLIGKEGYRYNALSYMLFNWLFSKYNLYIKLEIAEFLTSQQEMIRSYIEPVIEHVNINGKGKTRPLDGILVQIALEQLREEFPNKYVAVKTARDGRRFVLINEFNSRKND
jgi:spoIIIJ-associated protein